MIYLDNHSTTRMDPAVLDSMLPWLTDNYGNPGSTSHSLGRQSSDAVDQAMHTIGSAMNAEASEIIITSGATESNNLALFGVCQHPRQGRRQIISLATEHKAILDPLERLARNGFDVTFAPVYQHNHPLAGLVDLDQFENLVSPQTAMVTIMLANNEIGVIQPMKEIAAICRKYDIWLHTDATQAVGRMDVDVNFIDVDLLSFSAHKFYGPRGIGGLYVRQSPRRVKLWPQLVGGGQQDNRRSGTLNTPGIIGMAAAAELFRRLMPIEQPRIESLRNQLYERLLDRFSSQSLTLSLNGPEWSHRLSGNLNCGLWPFEGQSLMLETPELCVSSGSACTTADPRPSHVLQAIGLTEEQSRSSLRFGIGRFNTLEEIESTADMLAIAAAELTKKFG